jgi:FkbM family methyltransferase
MLSRAPGRSKLSARFSEPVGATPRGDVRQRVVQGAWRWGRRSTRTALNGLDDALEPHLGGRRGGYYVELGANDGVSQSNTYWLERERGWSGLLIEPALNRYLELRRNRSGTNRFFCAACVPMGFPDEFVHLRYANLMTVAPNLATDLADVEEHLRAARPHLEQHEEIISFGAVARTLQSLLDEAESPSTIDLLSLDVEGAEISVLKGVENDRTRFTLMLVESRNPDALVEFLRPLDYGLRERLSHHDYLFADLRAKR